jgi:hypothetical protein
MNVNPIAAIGLALSVLALTFSSSALADPGAAELAAAKVAEARGAEVFAYDQAAWHATDVYRDDLAGQGLSIETTLKDKGFESGGFIVEPAEGGLLLTTFFGTKSGKSQAMGRYWVRGSKVERGAPLKPGEDPSLSELATRLVAIRTKANAQIVADEAWFCTKGHPNTVILPPRADGSIPAYVMSASTVTGTFPVGGHYLFVYDAKGKLASKRAFSKSCIIADWRDMKDEAEGFGVSSLLDRQPSEVHVFISLNMPRKFFVIVQPGDELWEIDKGKVIFKQVMKPN